MVNSKELMIGAWVKSKKDLAKVTALYKENDGIHVEGNVFAGNETSVDVEYGGKSEKLRYSDGMLTLNFNYNNETTSFVFTKATETN